MRTYQYKYKKCLDLAPPDDDDNLTPAERHLAMVDYWQHKANAATLDRARGTYAALLPQLVAATGVPAQELVRRSVVRWLTARRREEEAQEAASREFMRRWYRTYGPGGHHQPDLEY